MTLWHPPGKIPSQTFRCLNTLVIFPLFSFWGGGQNNDFKKSAGATFGRMRRRRRRTWCECVFLQACSDFCLTRFASLLFSPLCLAEDHVSTTAEKNTSETDWGENIWVFIPHPRVEFREGPIATIQKWMENQPQGISALRDNSLNTEILMLIPL